MDSKWVMSLEIAPSSSCSWDAGASSLQHLCSPGTERGARRQPCLPPATANVFAQNLKECNRRESPTASKVITVTDGQARYESAYLLHFLGETG